MLEHTLRIFLGHPAIGSIHVIVPAAEKADLAHMLPRAQQAGMGPLLSGGETRQDSVWRGLCALKADPPDWVLIHDGARPFCSQLLLERVLEKLQEHPAVVPVLPMIDTLRLLKKGRSRVLRREDCYRSQTPQGFHWELIRSAFVQAEARQWQGTDDAQLVEAVGGKLAFVPGEERNLKITAPEDIRYAQWICQQDAEPLP